MISPAPKGVAIRGSTFTLTESHKSAESSLVYLVRSTARKGAKSMRYGEALLRDSGPKWAAYNVDYNDLKNIIKEYAKQEEVQAIAIPGQIDETLKDFEDLIFNELCIQHDRVGLFVMSKCYEIDGRLRMYKKQMFRLVQRSAYSNGQARSQQKKLAKFDSEITRCGEEIVSLQRFVNNQQAALQKLLKKFQKWTGSKAVEERFRKEVLNNAQSFTKRNFDLSSVQQKKLLITVRQLVSDSSISTPLCSSTRSTASLRSSSQPEGQCEPRLYWNEYNDGNEVEGNEPYTIHVTLDENSRFLDTIKAVNLLTAPIRKAKGWLSLTPSPGERRPSLENRALLSNGNGNIGYITEQTETDMADNAHASSTSIPSAGYATHYSTFPNVIAQKYSRYREKLLFRNMVGSFAIALVLSLFASLLLATSKNKPHEGVHTGIIFSNIASLFFAILALGIALCTTESSGWLRRGCIGFTFIALCVLNVILLVVVVGSSGS